MHAVLQRHQDAQIVQSTVQVGGRTPQAGYGGSIWTHMGGFIWTHLKIG
jgi:hypothetical protein